MSTIEIERGLTWEDDPEPDVSYLEQDGFEERRAAYKRGDYGYQGCYAWAKVTVAGVVQNLRSGGLWGIESDSDAAYKVGVEHEQWAELNDILKALGLPESA